MDSEGGDPRHVGMLKEFNKSVRQAIEIIHQIAQRDGKVDMVRYLMWVSWFDLGQLLYALKRGRSLTDSIAGLRHLTFGTRDF